LPSADKFLGDFHFIMRCVPNRYIYILIRQYNWRKDAPQHHM
jgi:hypothetical protein